MISPECRLWSPLQELAANRSPETLQFLVDARQENHDTHRTFVSVVYQVQYRAVDMRQLSIHGAQEHGRHEHWLSSMVLRPMWINANWVLNLKTIKDKCCQPESPHVSSQPGRMSKVTWVFMCALATMSILHVKAAFQDKVRRSKLAEDYPWQFARQLAYSLTQDDETTDDIHAAIDADEELHQLERERS